jgi:hypothetical protein
MRRQSLLFMSVFCPVESRHSYFITSIHFQSQVSTRVQVQSSFHTSPSSSHSNAPHDFALNGQIQESLRAISLSTGKSRGRSRAFSFPELIRSIGAFWPCCRASFARTIQGAAPRCCLLRHHMQAGPKRRTAEPSPRDSSRAHVRHDNLHFREGEGRRWRRTLKS